jgi:hypothetical protein
VARGKHRNLLEMTPRRVREWREGDDGRVRILVPRYGAHRLGRWVAARMGSKEIAVRLDQTGSRIWNACDGKRTVGEIASSMEGQTEDVTEDLMERIAHYFRELEVSRFISWS